VNVIPVLPHNRIVALYAAGAALWIIGTDLLAALATGGSLDGVLGHSAKGLLLIAVTSALLRRLLARPAAGEAVPAEEPGASFGGKRLAAVLGVMALVSGGAGSLFWMLHTAQLEKTNDSLASIGRLKVDQVQRELLERIADLDMLHEPGALEHPLAERLRSGRAEDRDRAARRIDAFRIQYDYNSVNAYGPDGRPLLASGAAWNPGAGMLDRALAQAVTQDVAFSIYEDDSSPVSSNLYFAAPVRDASGVLVAMLMARHDASTGLLRRLAEWPVPSDTGDVVVAVRQGGVVTYVSGARLIGTKDVMPRVKADLPELVAQQAFEGARGLVTGRDYRGVPVMAWVSPVAGTRWMLVAKIDREEVVGYTLRWGELIAVLSLAAIVLTLALLRANWERQAVAWESARLREKAGREGAERQLDLATRAGGIGTFEWDIAANRLAWNEQHALLWNTTLAAFPGTFEAFASQVHPDDMDLLTAEIAASRKHGREFALEFRVRRPDGGVRWIAARGRFVDDAPDKPGRMYGTVLDVTRSHEDQAERMRLLGLINSIISGSTDAIFVKDLQGRYLLVNAPVLAAFGKPEAEVLGRTDAELFPQQDATELMARDRVVRERGVTDTYEEAVHTALGVRTFLATKGPIFDGNGWVNGLFGIARDITDRVQAAAAMAESESRYRMMFAANPQPMWVLDAADFRILEVNEAAVATYGYPREEFLAMDVVALRPEEERGRFRAHLAGLKGGLAEGGHWKHMRRDGSLMDVVTRSHDIDWNGRRAWLVLATDVTEQEKAARALAESELRYRLLFQDNPHPMWVFDTATLRMLAVNDMAVAHYGYSREEFLAMTIMDLRPPEDGPRLQAHLASHPDGANDAGYWRHRLKDGTEIDVHIAVHATDWNGTPAKVILSIDVTAQRRAEAELRDALQMLELTVEGGEIGTWDWDLQTDRTSYNARWARMLGYEVAELEPNFSTWERLMHPDDLAGAKAKVQACIQGETPAYESEHRLRHKDGHWVWVLDKGKVTMHDTAGRAVRLSGTHLDISRRKRTDAALAEERLQLRAVVDQTIVGMYVIQDGRVAFCNQRYADILGYGNPEQLAGVEMLGLIAPEFRDTAIENVRKRVAGEVKSMAYEMALVRRDGSRVEVGVHGNAATWRGRPAVIGVLQDISDKKRAEESIQRYIKQIEDAFLRTVEVASALSEMRDPYTAGHERRVAELAVAIGRELGQGESELEGLRVAGMLHDVGKILVPAEILAKPGKLSPVEYELVKGHVDAGWNVLKNVEFPWPVADMVRQHHERLDGTGYPLGLKGEAILPQSRIMAVADTVEAMSSHRPYRPGLGIEPALKEIERGRGSIYDPAVVDACLRLFRDKAYVIPE
jgi:PAS domain S-box-containing protein/putative nucleotidyltransferase with HDIG domain